MPSNLFIYGDPAFGKKKITTYMLYSRKFEIFPGFSGKLGLVWAAEVDQLIFFQFEYLFALDISNYTIQRTIKFLAYQKRKKMCHNFRKPGRKVTEYRSVI